MNALKLTNHAIQRISQRGITPCDIDLVLSLGTEVRDGYLMREKDCRARVAALKREIERIERLEGKRVVIAGECVVTTFHVKQSEDRRLIRAAAQRDLEARP
jgi:hypothetical protein